ncbi:MAG: UDP-N-acetylmuramoyl-L-alanine--D-glutamate ligase [Frankiaceae bacterium]
MPAPTSWSDLSGRRVAVWGVGVEGQASVRRLRALGVSPALVDQAPGTMPDGTPVAGLAEGGVAALTSAEVVVKSPGISRYDALVAELGHRGVDVVGGLGLWLGEADRDRVLCVTGTKGKSTTTSIAGSLLRALGYRCFTGGNLGRPPWDPDCAGEADWWVVEVSSYQAVDVRLGPAVVAVTSLSQDHLTWHRGVENYYRDKLSLCTRPGVRSVVAEGHDPLLRRHAGLLGPHVTWVTAPAGPWAGGLGLLGPHNERNAAVARAALAALGVQEASDERALAAAAARYEPLPSRLAPVGRVGGVEFVDDSLSTNVLPTLAAVESFRGRRVALLVGGFERGIDYAPLGAGLAGRGDDLLVLTMPDNGPRIGAAIAACAGAPRVLDCTDVAAATRAAFEWASPDGVVLLSPAAPSFGRYVDYRARAAAFVAAMRALPSEGR